MQKPKRTTIMGMLAMSLAALVASCKSPGPGQRAGTAVDNAVDKSVHAVKTAVAPDPNR